MMSNSNRREPERRPESFDAVADAYDLYRSAYPMNVENAVVALSGLRRGSRVLEIGCGTGQLSVPLAKCGVELTAVELGPRLAARAQRNLEPYPNARVEVGSFEAWRSRVTSSMPSSAPLPSTGSTLPSDCRSPPRRSAQGDS
jgi:SAM-dependent methyltransferase